jgi:predicted DNA-binding transcriptional regulator YafY
VVEREFAEGIERLESEDEAPALSGFLHRCASGREKGSRIDFFHAFTDGSQFLPLAIAETETTLAGRMAKQRKNTKRVSAQFNSNQPLISYGARKVPPRLNKLLAILQRGGKHTARTLAPLLEISTFTVGRDLKALRLEHGVEIEYDAHNHTHWLKEKVTSPKKTLDIPFTEGELRVLRTAAKALMTTPDTGLGRQAMKIYEKLSLMLPELSRSKSRDDDSITFGVVSEPIYRKGVLKKVLDFYHRRREFKMSYETDPNPPEWRVVEARGVRLVNEMIYLIAYCPEDNKTKTYCATRIWDLKETGKTYEIPEDFDVEEFLKGNFGIVGGGKKRYKVVVRFAKKFSYLIRERKWKGEIKRATLPDGSFELHLRINSLWEFGKMLKGHPGEFTVLEPLELRQSILDAGRAMVRNNMIKGQTTNS